MPKKTTPESSSDFSKDEALNLLKAACKRNKQKKRDSFGATFFSLEDVDNFLAQQKNDDSVLTADVAQSLALAKSTETVESGKALGKTQDRRNKRVLKAASLSDILGGSTTPVHSKHPVAYTLSEDDSRVPEELKSYYQALVQLRYELKEGISALAKASLQESSGGLARYNTSDNGSDYFEQEIALGVVSSEKETLDEIEAAIQRIFDGSYGICEITGKPIPKKRLEAVPFTRYSLEGQKQMEEMRKARKTTSATGSTFTPGEEEEESVTSYFSDDTDEEE